MIKYKTLAVVFSYPDDSFFASFPQLQSEREILISEYDRLFRANEIWLYGAEYLAENEFQRADNLADIMGFYRAFGLEPNNDRPDSLSCELEFMHYLIFKMFYALEACNNANAKQNAAVCLDAQRKFFATHLYPAAKKIAEAIISQSKDSFYAKISGEMLEFLESEREIFLECCPRVRGD